MCCFELRRVFVPRFVPKWHRTSALRSRRAWRKLSRTSSRLLLSTCEKVSLCLEASSRSCPLSLSNLPCVHPCFRVWLTESSVSQKRTFFGGRSCSAASNCFGWDGSCSAVLSGFAGHGWIRFVRHGLRDCAGSICFAEWRCDFLSAVRCARVVAVCPEDLGARWGRGRPDVRVPENPAPEVVPPVRTQYFQVASQV